MSLAEKLIREFETLPEDKKVEVIDFVELLKKKTQKELEAQMDKIIAENRPVLEELGK